MQWTVQDNGKGTDPAGLEKALAEDLQAMQAEGGAMDINGLERRGFEAVRRQMDGPARLVKAVECKEEANAAFSGKDWQPAFVGYVAGIWFLQRGEPSCPQIVASSTDAAAFTEVAGALGDGQPTANDQVKLSAEEVEQCETLRVSLHLNLAAAALKLRKWEVARTACQYVLMIQGDQASPKARYRLAKAHEGDGNIEEAVSALEKLLTLDAGNSDAQALLETLRTRMPVKKVDYSRMGAEEWAKLSQEEQQLALEQINAELDAEMGSEPEWDAKQLATVMATGAAARR